MRDSEVVAAIVAGDPDGLAEAYDRYAAPLYTYCRSLLREPADAADAVQDTFVIAASGLAGLREPNRLRPWLYAVARNECHRRLRARTAQVATPLEEMPELTDTSADISADAERDELRTLLRSAVRGLGPGEQDLIELQLRQELDVAEIAAALGVPRNHAHALLSRARGQLETSLGALLVARTGPGECDALDDILDNWDGELTVLMRKRINRHIERCRACSARKRRELAPALLLGLAPVAALPGALPDGLRERVLQLSGGYSPSAAARRASMASRAGPFGHQGFPKALDPPKSPWWRPRPGLAAAAAGTAAVVAAGTLAGMALTAGSTGHFAGAPALGLGGGVGSASAGAGAGGGPGGPGQPITMPTPASGAIGFQPSPAAADATVPSLGGAPAAAGAAGAGGAPGPGSVPGYWKAAGGAGTSGGNAAAGSPAHGSSAPSSAKAAPGGSAPASSGAGKTSSSAPAAKPSSAAPPPAPGTLSVSPGSLVLALNDAGSLTLKASGGPVSWSIAESSGLVGEVTVSPSSGTLAAGQSATVSVKAGLLTLGGSLTVSPGGITVSIVLGTDL